MFNCSVVSDSATPWTAARQASLSFTTSRSLLKFIFFRSVMPSNHLILCHLLLLSSIFPSIRVFPSESVLCIRWPKYWSFVIFTRRHLINHPLYLAMGQAQVWDLKAGFHKHRCLQGDFTSPCLGILKSRDITLPTKVGLVRAMVFPVVMYGYENLMIKKAEHWRTDAFELWCWQRLFRVPWTARRSNQSILKEISPEYSLEGLMPKLKLQYFVHLMRRTDSLEKTLILGKIEGRRKRGR